MTPTTDRLQAEPGADCPHTWCDHAIDWRKVAKRLAYQVVLAERHPSSPGTARVIFDRYAASGAPEEVACHRLLVEAEACYPSEIG
jgi:hypothetical protein